MSEKRSSLYKKISAVMHDIQYLAKDDHIKFNKTNYRAISEEKVTSTVRESLLKNGLVILPVTQDHKREGTLSTVDTTYKIVDIDTGEHELIVSSGTGVDTQDKGVGKAMTYSYKYLLLRTFAIPTGEDPDKISSAELDQSQMNNQQQNQQRNQQQNQQNNQSTEESITPEQIGLFKVKAIEFGKMNGKTPQDVYDVMGVTDFRVMTKSEAAAHINNLERWISGK